MRHCVKLVAHSLIVVLIVVLIAGSAIAAQVQPTGDAVDGEVLVKIRGGTSANDVATMARMANADRADKISDLRSGALWRMHSSAKNAEALATALQKNPNVEYAEPNYILRLVSTPNDPSFAQLWGLKNTGQTISGTPGLAGSHIDAETAWSVTTGSSAIVIGVVDTGIDYTHPDLAANVWSNPGGKGNVACAAGTHGFNAITKTCDPKDDHYHGTHVSGTIGAVGNNAVGVAGVNWVTSIMGLKFLDAQGYGTTANAIAAVDFAIQAKIDGVNVRVLSNSWGGGSFSRALLDVINKANENDILFVASAGNDTSNNDLVAKYPASYATPNMISVAATDNRDALAYFSNYGLTTVHLGAPGVSVLSTFPASSYSSLSGTSMAAPHVAGVAALVLAVTPSLTTAQVKSAILNNTDSIASLSGKTVTGGRLNAARALGVPPGPGFDVTVNPASRTVVRGSSTPYTVTITPSNGFSGPVDLTVNGLPTGVSGSFSPASTTSTSTLTLTTTSSTPLNSHTFTITGVGGAVSDSVSATLVVVSTPPVTACPAFGPRSYYYVTNPTALAIGDLNRDGKADMAVANVNTNRVSVLLGTANGAFQSPANYAVGTAPVSVAIADLNDDGKRDVIVANSGSHNVSVLLGAGDGTLQAASHYGAGTNPFAVATGDFNADGKVDLAVANNGSANVSVLLGQGDGSFQAAVHHGTGSGPFAVAAGDFNRDGRADLAVAAFNAGKVSILLGNGDGSFGTAVDHGAANGPSGVVIGDLNGDGNTDVAVSNYNSNNVSTLAGNGDGTFGTAVHHTVGNAPYSVAAGDFNDDGKLDLVTANGNSANVSVLMGTGSSFSPALSYAAASTPNQAAVGDFNGDGRDDLAVANADDYTVTVLLNTGVCSLNCNIAAAGDRVVGTTPNAVVARDFNRDGRVDLATANSGSGNVSITLGNGDGTFQTALNQGAGTNPESVAAADFNRDGKLDVVTANYGSDSVSILLGNGDGTLQTAVHYPAGTGPRSVTSGDFNRDGREDLAVANGGSANVSILLGNGNGTFQAAVHYGAGTNPRSVAAGDFNRDGRADLAVANSGSADVSILPGNGDGTFQTATNVSAGTTPYSVVAEDFNRDGKIDLAVANSGSNNVSVRLGNGDGTFQAAAHYNAGTNPFAVTAGDLNSDGKLDLAIANNGSSNASILLGTGTGTFTAGGISAVGTGPAAIVAADLNRDGKPDLAVANSGSGTVSILLDTCPVPDLTITKTHAGAFAQGDVGKTYTITVSNSGSAPTDGPVSVTDVLPGGLSATAMSGTGWACSGLTCSRSDVLPAGTSYPAITLTVNVHGSAPASVTNTAKVSGGGELDSLNNTASDPTTVTPATDLIVTLSHTGSFTQGNTGRTYTIVARNAGGLATTGTVTVTDTLPSGLTATAISGNGWTCNLGTLTCTRDDVLSGSSSHPAITLTVNVAANAPALVTNIVTISGGGETNTANDTASDATVIWSSESCGGFASPYHLSSGSYPNAVAVRDFNGDGKADLAVAQSGSGTIAIRLGIGNGSFGSAVTYPTGWGAYQMAAGDLNNDGKIDLAVVNHDSGDVSILLGNGNGTFAAAVNYSVNTYGTSVAMGDLNNDGNADVAVVARYTVGVSVLLGNGDGTLQAPVSHVVGSYPLAVAISDFNDDGRGDLAVTRESGSLAIRLGNGDGSFQAAVQYVVGSYGYSLDFADFNGDGKRDIATTSYYGGVVNLMFGNGNGTFQSGGSVSGAAGGMDIVAEDLNGDGKADLVLTSIHFNQVIVRRGNGDGTFQEPAAYATGSGADDVAVGDFNADGKADLVVTNVYGANLAILLGGCPDLTIAKTHLTNFVGGQTNATYSLTVSNIGTGGTAGAVTVTDVLPAGLTAVALAGSGWTCDLPNVSCTRTSTLANGASYPVITLTVSVAKDAAASVTNIANVSGGGDVNNANNSASDPTTIVLAPDLTITKTHAGGSFAQGEVGRTYSITVANAGDGPTSGTVTVTDTLPVGVTLTAISGPGWNCVLPSRSCTRTDGLAVNATYPAIQVVVDINPNAPATLTNVATVGGGGDVNTSNNTASDVTPVLATAANLVATAISTSQVSLAWGAVANATNYQVLRKVNNGPFTLVGAPVSNTFIDTSVTGYTTYVYQVRAADSTAVGPLSNLDLATTILFTDEPIIAGSTVTRIVHFIELEAAVNAVRSAAGLSPLIFSDPSRAVGSPIKAVHVNGLRANLNEARTALGFPPMTYAEPTLGPGMIIKAAHIRELRAAVK